MDPDCSDGNKYQTPILTKKPLVAVPVSAGSSGQGLPYAPEDWPCPGDVWSWKVGKRISAGGFWIDRSLRPPLHLLKGKIPFSKQTFYSRLQAEQFVRKEFPEADVGKFFDSFIWKIPSKGGAVIKGPCRNVSKSASSKRLSQSKTLFKSGSCKAGNDMCSLQTKTRNCSPITMECDICCSEVGFCRDCCCILCCKTIDWAYDGYSFIRCEAKIDKRFICGHVAHMDCALRANVAGTVGGSIGLDVEYYCRRCDNKTDLISHVTRILHACKSLDSRDGIEKFLNLALCILHGSEQMRVKILWEHIQSAMTKLSSALCLGDIWKKENSIVAVGTETGSASTDRDVASCQKGRDLSCEFESFMEEEIIDGRSLDPLCTTQDHGIVSIKLEDEVDRALRELRKSQGSEYSLAEQKLYAQKDYLLSLCQQLNVERSELAKQNTSQNEDENNLLVANVISRIGKIKQEESRLRQMMVIAKGFGQASKQVLNEHFSIGGAT